MMNDPPLKRSYSATHNHPFFDFLDEKLFSASVQEFHASRAMVPGLFKGLYGYLSWDRTHRENHDFVEKYGKMKGEPGFVQRGAMHAGRRTHGHATRQKNW